MKFFEALAQLEEARKTNQDARVVEAINWEGERTCVLLNSDQEEQDYRDFNRDWGIEITRINA